MTNAIASTIPVPEVVELEPRHAAVVRVVGEPAQIPSLLGEGFEVTMAQIAASGGQVAGPPFARYLAFGPSTSADVGFPYVGRLAPHDRVHDILMPGGRAVLATYVGSYEGIADAWIGIRAWMQEHGLTASSAPWESYLTGPDDPGLPVTQIVFPID